MKRDYLKEKYTLVDMKKLKTIQAISVKSAADPNAVFDNLIDIISNEGILYQAVGNISGKSGALTPGTLLDPRTVDGTSSESANRKVFNTMRPLL